ncbi:sensor domain-containing diguanylate cyclase [Psychromonas algicola]|uniref:sensor domain-containing diguanylate cyclase n=1 Tax=Psychromonas algicola TaxID=2555642 RepID=UPI001067DED2|nr:diguanylate cyclase [Psychromonas sp. RZ5]TEW50132.1 sensor domain-containing diguanylate cyclase [Psychromonas sp. RZ5]
MSANIELKDIHWMIDMVHNIDVGIVIIDPDFNVKVWNGFMENHSGLLTKHMVDKKITDIFTSIPKDWLQHKVDSVCLLKNKAFTTWQQRPYLFKFKSYRPITSDADFMYQNVTFLPLTDMLGNVTQICMIVYDVTEVALNRLAFQEANKKLEKLSHTDHLTQLNNQIFWRENCALEFERAKQSSTPTTIIMIDIDNFKKINDTYGHQFGDDVIKGVADLIKKETPQSAFIGRIDGDRFAVLLTKTELNNAQTIAEAIRKKIEVIVFNCQEETIKVTASFGIAQMKESMADYQAWINITDLGLTRAKENGRNQVGIFEHE